MQPKYRLYQRSNRASGTFYAEDSVTRARVTLGTKDRAEAEKLLQAKNEAHAQPTLSRELAKVYIQARDHPKQREYAEALQEQNRAMQKRIQQLRQDADKLPGLQQELGQLKERAVEPELPAWEDRVPDPVNIAMFAKSDDQIQDFLLSQMQLNDVFTAELVAAERMKISAALSAPFLRRREFALLKP